MKMGMPSAILRKTLSCRFSPPAPAAPPCRRSRRPPSSRRGTGTGRPSTLRSTIAIAGGTGSESGVRSQRKRPSTLWAPGARRTTGSPSRSRTTAGRPSSSTDCGHRLSPPGRGRSRARSAWASERERTTLSRDGQLEPAGPEADGGSRHRGASPVFGAVESPRHPLLQRVGNVLLRKGLGEERAHALEEAEDDHAGEAHLSRPPGGSSGAIIGRASWIPGWGPSHSHAAALYSRPPGSLPDSWRRRASRDTSRTVTSRRASRPP